MVAGDVVNTAARLQTGAPPNTVIVGEETWRATRDVVQYEPAEPVDAKGKAEPLRAWIACAPHRRASGSSAAPSSGATPSSTLLRDVWRPRQRRPDAACRHGRRPGGRGEVAARFEFAREIQDQGGLVVRGRSLPYRESSAYGAFASHVKQLCRIFESDPPELAERKLRETVGDARSTQRRLRRSRAISRSSSASSPGTTVADRETLFFSVRCFIEAVASDRPSVLIFEDLHWADAGLLDLVELLGARLRDLPILVLVLARPDLLDARPGWGGGLPGYMTLALGPLSDEDADAAGRRAACQSRRCTRRFERGRARGDRRRQSALHRAARGDLARDVRLGSRVVADDDQRLLAARLDALPAGERSLLLDAAVSGKVFWRGALERMGAGATS